MRARISASLSVKGGAVLIICTLAFWIVPSARADVSFANDVPITPAQHPFTQLDLAGTWKVHHLNSGDAPAWLGWSHFDLRVDDHGDFSIVPGTYLNSSGQTDAASTGTISVTDDGILSLVFGAGSDNRNARGALSSTEEFAVATMDDEGGYNLSVLQRRSDVSFATSDAAGTWSVYGLVSGDAPAWTGWYHVNEVVDSNGVIHTIPSSYLNSAGETGGEVSGTMTLTPDGVIRVAEIPSHHGVLSSNKAVAVATMDDGQGGHHLTIALRRTGVLFARSDLTGRWHLHGLAVGDSPRWTGWIRGTMDIEADGTFAGIAHHADGETDPLYGRAVLTSDGILQLRDEGLAYAHGTMSNAKDIIALATTNQPGDNSLFVMTRAEPYVSLAAYFPIDAQTYGIKTYEQTFGGKGQFTGQVQGSEVVHYADGTSLTGANITGLTDTDVLVYNDGSVWKLLAVGDYYLSADEHLSRPSSAYTFGAIADGMLINHEWFWVHKDLSKWSHSDNQVVLCQIQDVTVLEGSYWDAVILWFLDRQAPFTPLQFFGKHVDLGITLPNSPDARPYAVTDFDIYAKQKGLVAQGQVTGTGELESLVELKAIEPVSTYTAAGVVYTDSNNPGASGLAGTMITLVGNGRTYQTSTAGVMGLWQIDGVLAGTYTLTPCKAGYVFEHMVDGESTGQPSAIVDMNAASEAANQSIQFLAQGACQCPDDDPAHGIYRICNYLSLNPGNQWVYTTGDRTVFNETYLSSYGWSGVRFGTRTYEYDTFLQNCENGLVALAAYDSWDDDFREFDPPFVLIPAEMQTGDSFQQTYVWPDGSVTYLTTTLLGAETITVPAGEFAALRFDIAVDDVGKCRYTTRLWFVKHVGIVRIHRVNPVPSDCLGCMLVCRPGNDIEPMNTPAELVSAIVDGRRY